MTSPQGVTGSILILARLCGALIYVPMPGIKSVAATVKISLAIFLTIALYPVTGNLHSQPTTICQMSLWLVGELTFGLMVGLFVGFLAESLVFGLQAIAVPAGFSYASTIDPNSEADSGVLQSLAQITSNLLFFHYGGDGMVLRAFSDSLARWPPGATPPGLSAATALTCFGTAMFELGLRIALPGAALLLLTDISLALMAKMQAQLQLLSLAFPVKMLGSLVVLAIIMPEMPILYHGAMEHAIEYLGNLLK